MIYVIYNPIKDQYIALDDSSGGYPYGTEWPRAKFWSSIRQASDYCNTFGSSFDAGKWQIHKVELKTVEVFAPIRSHV